MTDQIRFPYDPTDEGPLRLAIINAVALAHTEDVLDQNWILTNYINPAALNTLFFDGKTNMRLTFDVDDLIVSVGVDKQGNTLSR